MLSSLIVDEVTKKTVSSYLKLVTQIFDSTINFEHTF